MILISKYFQSMGKIRWAVAAIVLFSLRAEAQNAVVATNLVYVTTNYYIFGGTNFSQMRAAMKAARPWKDTMVYDAHTKWEILSNYHFRRDHDQVRLDSVVVTTKASMTLPSWIPGRPVSRELVGNWEQCLVGLFVHEQGHVQLAVAAGAEVRQRLQALPGFATPKELIAAADLALNDTVSQFREREVNYDAATRHGFTQGAILRRDAEAEREAIAAETPTAPPGPVPPRARWHY